MANPFTDFLALEDLIIAQVQANVTGLKKIYGSRDLATVTRKSQVTPSLAVIYRDYRVVETDGRKCRARVRQNWYTVLSVRNAKDQQHGAGVRDDAGPLMMDIIRALMGWQPGPGYSAMELVSAPPAITAATVGDFPIGWTTELYL